MKPSLPLMIPLLIGSALLAGALALFAITLSFAMRATSAEARYVGSVARTSSSHGGTLLYPQFQFRSGDGQIVVVTSTTGSTDQPYRDGETVPVLYDPSAPSQVRLETIWLWAGPLFLAAMGAMFVSIPLLILFAGRRSRLR